MTTFPAPLDQRFVAALADMKQRIAVLEQQSVQGAGAYAAFTCTSSTRPASPRAGQEIYETDTTRLLVWSGSAWEQKAFAAFVCTSSTNPASPFLGMQIYETDTSRTLIWSGTAWAVIVHTGAWLPYTCTWSGTGVSLGNGTIAGRWTKVGRAVTVAINFNFGSTTNGGTGLWGFSLPVTAASTLSGQGWAGSAFAYSSGANNRAGVFLVNPGSSTGLINGDNDNGWNGAVPQAWGSGDSFAMSVTYEVAS